MGAFVPGFDTDLFISYAHDDESGWVQAFEAELTAEVSRRLGLGISVWRDGPKLQAGDNWQSEILKGLKRTAAFLAIVSPNYSNSPWCARERNEFLKHLPGGSANSSRRVFKAVKTPWQDDAHRMFLSEIQDVDFYKRDADGVSEFTSGSRDFKRAVRKVADGLEALLRRMRRENQRVHVAWPTDDCFEAWKQLNDELRSKGFDVQPMGPRDASFADALLKQDMDQAVLSIHMLGAVYNEFAERIALMAADIESSMIFWISPAVEATADERQKAFIAAVRGGVRPDQPGREWPRGWSLMTEGAVRRFIDAVVTRLKPPVADPSGLPALRPASGGAQPTVYIVHDATTPEDTSVAMEIRDQISRFEKMEVFVSRADLASPMELKTWHEQMLRSCDGVLLYRNRAPEGWWNQLAPEVVFAERRFDRQPLKSRAFLVPEPPKWEVGAGTKVLPYRQPFQLNELEPFLTPLRQ